MARWNFPLVGLLLMLGLLQGCASSGPWMMPAKSAPETGAIFGSIEMEGNNHLLLRNVNIMKKGKVYGGLGRQALGERTTVLGNNYFIAPNVEPGTYFVAGFDAGNVYHIIPPSKITYFEVKPGQLKFLGAFWYVGEGGGMFSPGSFSLKPANTPSELTMLQWMDKVSGGTGWETSVHQRIRQLGGKPLSPEERAKALKEAAR